MKKERNDENVTLVLIAETMISFARKLLLAFIIIQLTEQVWLQVMLCMYLTQAYTMFSMYNCLYEERIRNITSNINEVIILLTIYHLFCFTDFVKDVSTRDYVGQTMVGLTFANMSFNLIPIVFSSFKIVLTKLKQAYERIDNKRKKL